MVQYTVLPLWETTSFPFYGRRFDTFFVTLHQFYGQVVIDPLRDEFKDVSVLCQMYLRKVCTAGDTPSQLNNTCHSITMDSNFISFEKWETFCQFFIKITQYLEGTGFIPTSQSQKTYSLDYMSY